ncbi:MAG TPA: hemerythrin domain-containing protein [Verrucomicrobiae bacterium]
MKITQALQAEHVVFHNLFDHVEKTVPHLRTLAEVRALAGLLERLLEIHSKVEDVLLMEPLEPSLHQLGQHENFHGEHEQIDAGLARIQKARTVAEARKLLGRAVVMSRRHFDKEERIVFPMAERILSAHTLLELGKRWEAQRKELVG